MTSGNILDRANNWVARREKIMIFLMPLVLPTFGAMAYRYLVIDDVRTRMAIVEGVAERTRADVTDLLTFDCLKTPIDSLRAKGLFHMIARCNALLDGR